MNNRHRYPPEWFDTIRPTVLRRDQYKCHVCGATQRSIGYYLNTGAFVICDEFMRSWAVKNNLRLYTIHLQVAHLDQDPSNNNLTNLRTYCPRHHLQYDAEFKRLLRLGKRA